MNYEVGVGGSGSVVAWEKEFNLDYTVGIGWLNGSQPGVVKVGQVVRVAIAIANRTAVCSLEVPLKIIRNLAIDLRCAYCLIGLPELNVLVGHRLTCLNINELNVHQHANSNQVFDAAEAD